MVFASAMATAAAGYGVWQYNRENYMFNVPVQQAMHFQIQNVVLARFALFREDIRDLAALTINKIDSYLIVNTLKLGFIVTVYFNFDRTDDSAPAMTFVEQQINVIFTMTLLTSFFWLACSIWFSMHALVLVQSISTKMLVQTMRIPFPTDKEVEQVTADAQSYEGRVHEAFRIPFVDTLMGAASNDVRRPQISKGAKEDATGSQAAVDTSASHSGFSGGSLFKGAGMGNMSTANAISIFDLMEGDLPLSLPEELEALSGIEPHLKLYTLLRASWAAYELYGHIAMNIGTTTLMSGLGYFSLFYMQIEVDSPVFVVKAGGWASFAFMSLLAWWSLVIDLGLPISGHCFMGMLILAGPAAVIYIYSSMSKPRLEQTPWAFPTILTLQASWILLLLWSSIVSTRGRRSYEWPSLWRASVFVNALHAEKGPPRWHADNPRTIGNQTADPSFEVSSEAASSVSTEDDEVEDSLAVALVRASMLLVCLDGVLSCEDREELGDLGQNVRRVRDQLYEMTRAAGTAGRNELSHVMRSPFRIAGFYVVDNRRSASGMFRKLWDSTHKNKSHWVDPHGSSSQFGAPRVSLDELMRAVGRCSRRLQRAAGRWSPEDMDRLTAYGGQPVPGIRSFRSQFTTEMGLPASDSVSGKWHFTGGVIMNTMLWLTACVWSWNFTCKEHCEEFQPKPEEAVPGILVNLKLKPAWLMPQGMGCQTFTNATRIVIADQHAGAYFENYPGSGQVGSWHGPVTPCAQTLTWAADFGPLGSLWFACGDGLWRMWLEEAKHLPSQPERVMKLDNVELFAVDSEPLAYSNLIGLVQIRGHLVAIEKHGDQYKLAGRIIAPANRWTALALAQGRGYAMDANHRIYAFDALTGTWDGPYQMPTNTSWFGLCAEGENTWLALGSLNHTSQATGIRVPRMELWRFARPSVD